MESTATTYMKSCADAIGFLIDRTFSQEQILGTVWLVEDDKVATSAHSLVLYAEYLPALKVRFPTTGKEHGIAKVLFHPHFNSKLTAQLAQEPVSGTVSMSPLQQYNAAVLALTPKLAALPGEESLRLNQKLSLPVPQRDQGLGGNLSEIDLVLVIQTINNARREGVLIVSDERNRPFAQLFCQDGRLMYALYKNLVNEAAVYQMISHNISGNFFFTSKPEPDWEVQRAITRPTDGLLLEAHRRLDELTKLGALFGGPEAVLAHSKPDLNLDVLPPELKEQAIILWNHLDGTAAAKKLWQLANMDNYTIFQVASELWKTRQVTDIRNATRHLEKIDKNDDNVTNHVSPLRVNSETSLAPWDKIDALIIDPVAGTFKYKSGSLLGTLRSSDSYHLVHNLSLLPDAAGTPLFKDGQVIGMHCGALPVDPTATDSNVQQMLWAQAVVECLTQETDRGFIRHLTMSGEDIAGKIPPFPGQKSLERLLPTRKAGCKDVARIDCPRCGSSHLDSARFCKTCGQRLIQDIDFKSKEKPKMGAMLALTVILAVAIAIPAVAWLNSPRPLYVTDPLLYLSTKPTLDVELYRAKVKGLVSHDLRVNPAWEKVEKTVSIKKGDGIHVKIKVNEPAYVYVLTQGTTDNHTALIYPDPNVKDVKEKDIRLNRGITITVPETTVQVTRTMELAPGERPGSHHVYAKDKQFVSVMVPGGPPGTDRIIVLASHSRSVLCGQPDKGEELAKKVLTVFKQSDFPEGVEIDQDALGKDLFEQDVFSGKRKEKRVYLQLLNITHD